MTDLFDSAINTEYMPSQRVPNASDFFGSWGTRSAAVREQYPPQELAYGPGEHERLDVFEPLGTPLGTVLWIHGGYWMAFYKDSFSYLAPPVVEAGYRVAVMSYDLVPSVSLKQIVRQARQAASFVSQRYGALVVAGHSAGGHLTAMIHCADWPAEGLPAPEIVRGIGISGLYDLRPLRLTELQPNLRLTESQALELSPVGHQPTTSAPFVVAVGALESDAFHTQSAHLTQVWAGVATSIQPLLERHHFDGPDELLWLTQLSL
ncbi:alpha/beta hydrolase [Deinococcus sp.]|uniref:alpha/beta hydrolase n=1 Tax=Deinococcus sp. TaxID=47478 RepID=UPI0025BE5E30|nr:alpha/beta hydrolase [Deinococcus sp.]